MENSQTPRFNPLGSLKPRMPHRNHIIVVAVILALVSFGIIAASSPSLTFTIPHGTANEGALGDTLDLNYEVSLTQGLEGSESITVRMTTVGTGTIPPTAGIDYTATEGFDIVFTSVSGTKKTYTVTINGDNDNETDEVFDVIGTVIASNVASVTIGTTIRTTTTIIDDDNPYITGFSSASITEGPSAQLEFTVTLNEAPMAGDTVSVAYHTGGGTATDGVDYSGTGAGTSSITISNSDGATKKIIILVTNDLVHEPDETFTIDIIPASSSGLNWPTGPVPPAPPTTATGTIIDPNDAPSAVADSYSTDEDMVLDVPAPGFLGVLNNDSDPEGAALTAVLVTGPSNGVLSLNTNGSFTYTPNGNFNGTDTFTYKARDPGPVDSAPATVTITVNAINDVPSFTKGADVAVNEDSGAKTVTGWATAISRGGGSDENGQTLTFNITNNTNPTLFSAVPAVASNGTLTFTPANDANGVATITLTIMDNGGTANGGVDTSASQSFVITVNAVNDVPSFTKGPDITVIEDSGLMTQAGWASAILRGGGSDENSQNLTFNITGNTNTALFAAGPAIAANGTLTFTPANNANGTATITVTLSDSGGTANGGVDTSVAQSFVITVNPVNDAPTYTNAGNVTVNENLSAYSAAWASNIVVGPSDESAQSVIFTITGNTNPGLFAAGPAIAANGTLTFTPATDTNGSADITVQLKDTGGVDNGGDDTAADVTFRITVTPINNPPTLTPGGPVTVNEDSGAYSAVWATNLSRGPADESGQTLTIAVTGNTNAALFGTAPAIAADGTLTFTPAANANGSADITVRISDNGSNTAPSKNFTDYTFTITVTAVNDAPTLTPGGNVGPLNEDSGAHTTGWFTPATISAGPADEIQTVTLTTTNDKNGFFTVQPSIDIGTGVLSFTLAADANGTATVTVTLTDSGSNTAPNVNFTNYTFDITVDAINDTPSFTKGADVSVNEDATYSAAWATAISHGAANENTQILTFNVTVTSGGALFASGPAIAANGTLSFTLAADVSGTANISVTLSDDGGGANTSTAQTFVITVNAVNDAPTLAVGGNVVEDEDFGAYSANWFAPATLVPGPTDELPPVQTVSIATSNDNNSLFSVQPLIDAVSGDLTFTTAANANGVATVTVTLTDTGSSSAPHVNTKSYTFTITINAVADDPVITNLGLTIEEGETSSLNGRLSTTDGDGTPATSLVFTVTTLPTNGDLLKGTNVIALNGTFTQDDLEQGLISYRHGGGENLADTFDFSLSGGSTLPITGSFAITITAKNDAPIISLTPGATSYLLGAAAVVVDSAVTVSDPDSLNFNGGQATVTLITNGSAGDVLNVQNGGLITISGPTISYNGTAIGTITVGVYPTPLTVTLNTNATPTAVTALFQNVVFSNVTALTTPSARSVEFTVSDGSNTSIAKTRALTINSPPTAVNDTPFASINSGAQTIAVLANDSDFNGHPLTITAVTQGTRGVVAISADTKSVTYNPEIGYMGPDTFTYTISDGQGGVATATVNVTVREAMAFIPLMLKPAFSDLVVSIKVTPTSPLARKPALVELTVTNMGDGSASNFWTDFYINPSHAPNINEPWHEVCGIDPCYGLAWYYTGTLAPGQSIVLNSNPQDANNPNGFNTSTSDWRGFFIAETTKIYAIVDSWNRDTSTTVRNPNGAIFEKNETNNRAEQNISVQP